MWNTQVTFSISTNMSLFQTVKCPFKNLLKVACTEGLMYCASTFRDTKRDSAHWQNGAQLLIIDFDEGLTEYTKEWLGQQFGFLIPTRNHLKDKKGIVCERYRAVLLFDSPLNVTSKEFVNIHKNILQDNYLPADKSCTDVSRMYYGANNPENHKYIKVLNGKPFKWQEYNYEDTVEMIGLPSTKRVVDTTPYEHIDLRGMSSLNHSKRYECPICAMEGLDPRKHHMGFSVEKDLITCFYDKEGHSPILRALYQKQMYGEIVGAEEGNEADQEQFPEDYEACPKCDGTGIVQAKCPKCKGSGVLTTSGEITQTTILEDGTEMEERTQLAHEATCPKCKGTGTIEKKCPTCKGTGKKRKAKPRVKKPSLPDDKIPLKPRVPRGEYHFNQNGIFTDFEAEIAKYTDANIIGYDIETYYPWEVAVTEEEAKTMFKEEYISISATYKRVVKNLKEKALDEIDNAVRIISIGSSKNLSVFDITILTEEQLRKLLELIASKIVVGHNLKFDLKSVASKYGFNTIPSCVWDTMLASKILWMAHETFTPNEHHTLGSVVYRFTGKSLAKGHGSDDWGVSHLTREQLIYCLEDVQFLLPVLTAQIAAFQEEMKNYHAQINWTEEIVKVLGKWRVVHPVAALEMRFLLNCVRTELHGVMVNETKIRELVKKHLKEVADFEEKYGFNPASAPQCLKFVRALCGPQMESASKEALAEYVHIPDILALSNAKKAKSRAGLLVKMYDHKADGRIHTQYTQILATSRMASKNPNMQQIPRTDKGDIYKAPEGRMIISADYPAIEMRLGAAYHKEPVMIQGFRENEDLHYKMAEIMTGKKIPHTDEEKHSEGYITKEERTSAKSVNFGFLFGGWWTLFQKNQLVKNHVVVSDAEAKKARESYMRLYKTIALHIEQTKTRFEKAKPQRKVIQSPSGDMLEQFVPYREEVENLFGRRIAVETANTALNYPIQSSGSDAIKLSCCLFEDKYMSMNLGCFIVNYIHDDTVVELDIDRKDEILPIFAECMNAGANALMGHFFKTDVTSELDILAPDCMKKKD